MAFDYSGCTSTSFWSGDIKRKPCCSETQRQQIDEAWQNVMAKVQSRMQSTFPTLWQCIVNRYDGDSMYIKCLGNSGGSVLGSTTLCGHVISLYEPHISNYNPPHDDTLEEVLLHEMIHACCGEEIDAYAITNWLYGTNVLRDTPISKKILNDEYDRLGGDEMGDESIWLETEFLFWNPRTGEIYQRDRLSFPARIGKQIWKPNKLYRIDGGGGGCC